MAIALLLICLAHFFVDFCVGIWPLYKTVAGIDLRAASLIAGISGFIGEGMQLAFGYVSDRGRRKQVMILGILLSASIFYLSSASAVSACFILILAVMVGSGAFHPAAVGFVGSLSEKGKGKLILGFAFAGALGQGCSQLFYMSFFKGQPERLLYIALFIAAICFVIVRFRFTKEPPSREKLTLEQFLVPFRTRKRPLLLLYFSQIANHGLLLAFLFLMPDLLREKSCNYWLCHGGGQLCFLLGACSVLLPAGFMIDRFGPRPMMIVASCISILLFYTMLFAPIFSSIAFSGLLALFGASSWMINPLIVTWGNRLVPESPSFVSGLMMGMAWCFAHLTTIVSGLLTRLFPSSPCHLSLAILGVLIMMTFAFAIAMPGDESVVIREDLPAS